MNTNESAIRNIVVIHKITRNNYIIPLLILELKQHYTTRLKLTITAFSLFFNNSCFCSS